MLLAPTVWGADLIVSYRVTQSSPEGELVRGTLLVEAFNTSGQSLNNVNIRIQTVQTGGLASLVQLGSLPPSGRAVETTQFVLGEDPATSEHPLEWSATFIDAAGANQQLTVSSQRED